MKFINRSRCSGKTSMLINTAHITGYPIVVENTIREKVVYEQARRMGINDINVLTIHDFSKGRNHTNESIHILIDEGERIIEMALNNFLGAYVVACTFSIPYENINQDKKEGEKE